MSYCRIGSDTSFRHGNMSASYNTTQCISFRSQTVTSLIWRDPNGWTDGRHRMATSRVDRRGRASFYTCKVYCNCSISRPPLIRAPSKICIKKKFIFGHVTVIEFQICCCVPNFVKIGWFSVEISCVGWWRHVTAPSSLSFRRQLAKFNLSSFCVNF